MRGFNGRKFIKKKYASITYVDAADSLRIKSASSTHGIVITGFSPADATPYYFDSRATTMTTTESARGFKFNTPGELVGFSFGINQTGNGSNENVSLYLRNSTTAQDYLIDVFTANFGASTTTAFSFSGLNIPINTSDRYVFKILTPTWGTNPTSWTIDFVNSINEL